jgi:hypothetical protein
MNSLLSVSSRKGDARFIRFNVKEILQPVALINPGE